MNILGLGPLEILLIVVLALIVFGPAKLPEIMGQIGRAIADFRRTTGELSDEFNRTIAAELQETRSIVDETKSAVTGVQTSVNAALAGATAAPTLTTPAPAPTAVTAAPTNGTNGIANAANGNAQWSYETSAPAPAGPAVELKSDASGLPLATPDPSAPVANQSAASAPPRPSVTRKSTRRDDLLPPY